MPVVSMAVEGEYWLLLLILVCGPVFGDAPGRRSGQADWWRHYQIPVPAQGSPRGVHRENSPQRLVGMGSLRGSAQNSRWPSNWHGGALPRQMPPMQPPTSPINIECSSDTLLVRVNRDFYGNGILVQLSELSLGPQSCNPSPQSNDTTIVFLINVQDCGSTLQVTSDNVIYSSVLTYSPLNNAAIIRTNPAVVPIHCIFPRQGNVSIMAVEPTWAPFSTTAFSHDKLIFSLRLMTEDWNGQRSSSVFQLGQSFNIEASVITENHMNLILFVDSCVATVSPDPSSSPSYEIISYNGCLMDALKDDTSSAFRSPRIQPDKLQFTVEAFRFLDVEVSVIYITCILKAVSATQVPDSMNKACSYNRDRKSWSPLEGSSDICQCCNTGGCQQPSALGGRRVNVGRPRGFWKRHAVGHHTEKHYQAILGPLLVIGAEHQPAPRTGLSRVSRTTSEPQTLELWVLVAVASTSLVVAAVGVACIGKLLLNRFSHKAVEQ